MNWIKVSDRLPNEDEIVFIWDVYKFTGNVTAAWLKDGKWYCFHTSSDNKPIKEPTHWAEITPPDENK